MGAVLTAAQVNEPQRADRVGGAGDAGAARVARARGVERGRGGRSARERDHLASPSRSSCCTCARWRGQLFGDERAATPVAFTGGMLTKGTTLRKRLEQRLKSAVPGAQLRRGRSESGARSGARCAALRGRDDRRQPTAPSSGVDGQVAARARSPALTSATSSAFVRRRDDGRHAERLARECIGHRRVLRRQLERCPPTAPSRPSRGSCRRG